MHDEIYIDAEWYIGGNVFLLGYAYNDKDHGHLYDRRLNIGHINNLIGDVEYIYVYGPDVGVLENHFDMNLRDNYICVNLLKIIRRFVRTHSYKLADLEKLFGLKRNRAEYKKSIFDIWSDWRKRDKRDRIIEYNREDVINMMKLWKIVRRKYNISNQYLIENRLL